MRVGAFLAVVVLLGAIGLERPAWYARSSYFVGLQGQQVAIFKGRPGGMLWFKPTLVERTRTSTADMQAGTTARSRGGQGRAAPRGGPGVHRRLAEEAQPAAERAARASTTRPGHRRLRRSPRSRRRLLLPRHPAIDTVRRRSHRAGSDRSRRGHHRRCLHSSPASGRTPTLPAQLVPFLLVVIGLLGAGTCRHCAAWHRRRIAAPPIAGLLNGLGYVFIARLDRDLAGLQAVWIGHRRRRLRRHAARRPPRPRPRALPLHLRRSSASPCCSCRCCPASAASSTAPGSGSRIGPISLPARRAGQDRSGHLLRLVPRTRSASSSACAHRRHRPVPASPTPPPRAAAPRLGRLAHRHGGRARPRLVAAVLRPLHHHAVGRHRRGGAYLGARRPAVLGAARSSRGTTFAPRAARVRHLDQPVAVADGQGLPDRPGALRVRLGRHRRDRPRSRQPADDPGRRRPTSSSPPSARSSASSAPPAIVVAFLLMVGCGSAHRHPGRATLRQAARRRPHHDPRPPDLHHHRRRHPARPPHRHHPAVRLLRRLVARRQLRAAGPAAAHRRRHREAKRQPLRARTGMNDRIRRRRRRPAVCSSPLCSSTLT